MYNFTCKNCHQHFEFTKENLNQEFICPCGEKYFIGVLPLTEGGIFKIYNITSMPIDEYQTLVHTSTLNLNIKFPNYKEYLKKCALYNNPDKSINKKKIKENNYYISPKENTFSIFSNNIAYFCLTICNIIVLLAANIGIWTATYYSLQKISGTFSDICGKCLIWIIILFFSGLFINLPTFFNKNFNSEMRYLFQKIGFYISIVLIFPLVVPIFISMLGALITIPIVILGLLGHGCSHLI